MTIERLSETNMITIDFTVPGKPMGKERPRVTTRGTYTPQKTKDYEEAVRKAFYEALLDRTDGYSHDANKVRLAEVYITAYFGVPRSWSLGKKRDSFHQPAPRKPDADNIEKVICDALNGAAYKDDACVTELDVSKRYCGRDDEPRVEVTVGLVVDGA